MTRMVVGILQKVGKLCQLTLLQLNLYELKYISDMTNREKRHARKSWRQRKQHQKKKQTSLNRHLNDTQPPTPNTSVSGEYRRKWRSGRTRAVCYREVDKLKIKLQTKTREANRCRKR